MRFSDIEISELTKAWVAISLAFSFIWRDLDIDFWIVYLMAALTVGLAFLLHELAHKYTAQRYGCWAEFRAYNLGLVLSVFMSLTTGFIFAAPGAVIVSGLVTTEENGKIAASGPITNIILALLFLGASRVLPYFIHDLLSATMIGLVYKLLQIGYSVNSWLALFNLIPLGPLDGVSVMKWSQQVWLILIAIAGVMVFA